LLARLWDSLALIKSLKAVSAEVYLACLRSLKASSYCCLGSVLGFSVLIAVAVGSVGCGLVGSWYLNMPSDVLADSIFLSLKSMSAIILSSFLAKLCMVNSASSRRPFTCLSCSNNSLILISIDGEVLELPLWMA